MKTIRTLLAAAVAVAAFSSAHAQDGTSNVTLQVNRGSVMVSQEGGEFATVSTSAQLRGDSRIMLAEDSAGTLIYDNGCRLRLETPGVHGVPDREACMAALATTGSGAGTGTAGTVDWQSAGLLFAGTAAVAAILANMGDGDPFPPPPPPPVSP